MTPSLPRKCSTTELRGHIPVSTAVVRGHCWSGRRDSNPRPIAWKAITLPTELLPLSTVCEKSESVRNLEPDRSDCRLPAVRKPPFQTAVPNRRSGGTWSGGGRIRTCVAPKGDGFTARCLCPLDHPSSLQSGNSRSPFPRRFVPACAPHLPGKQPHCQGGYGKCHIIRTWRDGFKLKMEQTQAAGRGARGGRGGEGELAKGIEPPTY